jgi:hypothetical protein
VEPTPRSPRNIAAAAVVDLTAGVVLLPGVSMMPTARDHERNGMARSRRLARLVGVLLAALLLVHAPAALAALGATREDLLRDAAALQTARVTITSREHYDVHEMISADGTTVRAYVEPGGRVFAVTGSGRVQPDLRVVLGPFYARYLEAARAPHPSHHVLTLTSPDLVLSVVKLPRGFAGRAHLPSLVPAGTAVETLR